MKKTYSAPSAEQIAFDTEEILGISLGGNSSVLTDSDDNRSSKAPAKDFGEVTLF